MRYDESSSITSVDAPIPVSQGTMVINSSNVVRELYPPSLHNPTRQPFVVVYSSFLEPRPQELGIMPKMTLMVCLEATIPGLSSPSNGHVHLEKISDRKH